MFTAIAALISSILGFAGSIITSTNARYLQRQSEYEASIDFARSEDLSIYDAYNKQATTRIVIIVCGLLGLIALAYFLNKKK